MTPRKELFTNIKTALKEGVLALELVDLKRNKKKLPEYFTAAFIAIKSIDWQGIVEQGQEGKCVVDVIIYCKDGWADQHDTTTDSNDGLSEIDLIDSVVETLQGLSGDFFKPLQLITETDNEDEEEMTSYTLSFETLIYRTINQKYTKRTLTVIPANATAHAGDIKITINGTIQ
jgi:hypothetical protein